MAGRTSSERPAARQDGTGWVPTAREGLPSALDVRERAPEGGWKGYDGPVVVLVHGSLDRGASFERTALRLRDMALVTYDRRGYRGSRADGPAELRTHVEDLVRVGRVFAEPDNGEPGEPGPPRPVVAVGHSVGGTLVLWAAVEHPDRFASVGAYEPSMPWLGFHRPQPTTPRSRSGGGGTEPDPGAEAERFFRRMVGDQAWRRLPEHERASRRADGPALLEDLRGIRGAAPFDVTALRTPAVVAAGGPASFAHHRQTVEWLSRVPAVHVMWVSDAGHGAHLSHPDAFAALVRRVVALA